MCSLIGSYFKYKNGQRKYFKTSTKQHEKDQQSSKIQITVVNNEKVPLNQHCENFKKVYPLNCGPVKVCCRCNKPKIISKCFSLKKYKSNIKSNKYSLNKRFGKLLTCKKKENLKKYRCKYRRHLKRFRFLLKIDEIDDKTKKLLNDHQICKENKKIYQSKFESKSLDRRIWVIEHTLKCSVLFPGNLQKIRYKGIKCIKVAIEANSVETIRKAVNLIKTEIPLMYKECIFHQKLFPEKPDFNLQSISQNSNNKQFVINRPKAYMLKKSVDKK